jgi:transcriptional regulator with XRE-family HTH domain
MSPADNRLSRDPDLARLHEALTQPAAPDDAHDASDDATADGLTPFLDASMVAPTVQRYLTELLIGGEVPTPATRQKLVDAAGRSLRVRRDSHATLPAMLALKRQQERVPVSRLAADLELTEKQIYDMESGQTNVRTVSAERIARWVQALHVDASAAIDALRETLLRSVRSRSTQAAGRGAGRRLSEGDERLLGDVAQRLGMS